MAKSADRYAGLFGKVETVVSLRRRVQTLFGWGCNLLIFGGRSLLILFFLENNISLEFTITRLQIVYDL
jgi:hypothetical protein